MNRNNQKYKFAICSGNNSNIIRRCMKLREERWEETNSFDKLYNFKWQPFSRGIKFESVNSFGIRQLVNHLPNHQLLTTKHQLFESMAVWCEQKRLNVFDFVPVTFTLQMDNQYCCQELDKFLSVFNSLMKTKSLEETNTKVGANLQLPMQFKLHE